VVIVADADKPGRAHARQVAASLEGIAGAVEIVEAAAGKDAADHLAAGKTVGQFVTTDATGTPVPELAPDLYEFLAQTDPAEEWVIPHLLERGDRLIWTGVEGLGKTVVTRQLAIAAAAGLHPFTDTIFQPQRVLFIDCENAERKSRRRFRELEAIARFKRRPVPEGGFRIIHRPEAIDLSREEESAWLFERVTAHKPDLLVIGPLYKLHALDINEELAARSIVTVLDQARARADCAVIIEGHAPHGDTSRARELRPVGSSLFMRWPEFGYGIREAPKTEENPKPNRRRVIVKAWRGPRDEREWPTGLRWGDPNREWPWVPVKEQPQLSVVDDAG
jgi:RecA-family ATPase